MKIMKIMKLEPGYFHMLESEPHYRYVSLPM